MDKLNIKLPRESFADGVARNFIGAFRLATVGRCNRDDLRLSVGHLVFALFALWIAMIVGAKMAAGARAEFWIWGIAGFAAQLYVWLTAVALLCWLYGRAADAVAVVIVLIYTAVPVALFSSLCGSIALALGVEPGPDYQDLFINAVLLWNALCSFRTFALMICGGPLKATAATLLYAGAAVAIVDMLPAPAIFYRPEPSVDGLDIEAIYYRQPDLVERQLATLSAERPGVIDIYFVSLAAFASQDVFMQEALGARRIAEQRLALGQRSMSLINNHKTLDELPLANLPNLQHTMRRLAQIIDVNNDIVFLFLTSHGSESGSLTSEFSDIAPNDLYPHAIRQTLDESGILWRVVVISACYSGSFIDELRSPNTLVITAAAADRASFGCRHENNWTYFGQAYFAQALQQTRDLVHAFALATAAIERRERDEGKLASHPQHRVGKRIKHHLQQWLDQVSLQ